MSQKRVPWHPAFYEALRQDLKEYEDVLQYEAEHQLAKEPLRIDVLIIKKNPDVTIKKNIAAIFRRTNVVEYKNPGATLSVADFYKTYAYVCLYLARERQSDVRDMSLSLVTTTRPRKLLRHLRAIRGCQVEEVFDGIFYVRGDILPIQIIESKRLHAEDSFWLKSLSNDLDVPALERVVSEYERLEPAAELKAYLGAVSQANPEALKEVISMGKMTLEQVFIETGLYDKVKAASKAEGKAEGEAAVLELLRQGRTLPEIEQILGKRKAKVS
jgi:hypothetical protein